MIWETPEEVRIIEVGCPSDPRVSETQKEKEEKYIELQTELSKLRKKKVVILTIVVGNTGVVASRAARNVATLGTNIDLGWLQKIALTETAKIISTLLK